MANRESYPASLFPLRGDISAEAGATSVVVQGLQTIPISTQLPDGSVAVGPAPALVALGGSNVSQAVWTPVPLDNCILVNGVPKSDDYDISVNLPLSSTNDPVFVNGA